MKIFIIIYAVIAFILLISLLITDLTIGKSKECKLWSIWDIAIAVFWPIAIVFAITLSVIGMILPNDKGSSEDPL